jgi:hypothetical protein
MLFTPPNIFLSRGFATKCFMHFLFSSSVHPAHHNLVPTLSNNTRHICGYYKWKINFRILFRTNQSSYRNYISISWNHVSKNMNSLSRWSPRFLPVAPMELFSSVLSSYLTWEMW